MEGSVFAPDKCSALTYYEKTLFLHMTFTIPELFSMCILYNACARYIYYM